MDMPVNVTISMQLAKAVYTFQMADIHFSISL